MERIAELGITGRRALQDSDSGLYDALRRRGLLDKVGLGKNAGRNWAGMEEDELLAFAKGVIADREIRGKDELKRLDSGLYDALRHRGLLGRAFEGIER